MKIRTTLSRSRLLLAALACLLGLFACTLGGRVGSGGVLQQDWDKRRGPVVPHDSFPRDCSMCHAGTSWSNIRPDFVFDHEKETGVALRGAHARAECLRCHNDRGPVQDFAAQGCVGCHDDIHRGKQGTNCTNCHNESGWSVNDAIALHSKTRFPLFGVHASVECWRCHAGAQVGNFDRAPVECASCHQEQLASATNPNHVAQGWVQDCQHCHAPVSWGQGDFNHSWFALIGHHAPPQRQCVDCHVGQDFIGTPKKCEGCHGTGATINPVYDSTTNPSHVAAAIPQACVNCHSPLGWRGGQYNHSIWPLTGNHSVGPRACADCHAQGVFQGTPSTCYGCHSQQYNDTATPNHDSAGYPTSCANCHDTVDFHTAVFNHVTWPLTGTHLQANCTACHTNPDYSTAPVQCIGCHQADYDQAQSPSHVIGGFPANCERCHTTLHFTPSNFNHTDLFPLTNGHALPPRTCTDCHTGGNFETTPSTCVGCHGAAATINPVYNPASSMAHQQLGANGATCTNCHNNSSWLVTSFDHSSFTLTGAHLFPTLCAQCHLGGSYGSAPNTCVGCHLDKYQATTNPPHAQSNFQTTCQDCHNTLGWQGANFTHSMWPLTGLHTTTACTACHQNNVYDNAPLDCVGCHLANYTGTTNPSHVSNSFPQTCQTCHTTSGWAGSSFNHSWWPLTGQHTVPPRLCSQCHVGGNYSTNPATTCVGCHISDFTSTTNPPHAQSGFAQTCETCHTTSGWAGANFDHSGWPLTGSHTVPPRACIDCHAGGNYTASQPTTCVGCHIALYQGTTNPPHAAGGFAQTCQDCHNTDAWQPATVNHALFFPLTGAHVSPPLACTACHLAGNYRRNLPQNCAGCHGPGASLNPVYSSTSNSTHQGLGASPPACTQCHGNTTWTPSSFSHASYPLTGQHTSVACSLCHTGGSYQGAPTNCVGCHMSNYNGTTNPSHASSNFPTTCEVCHTTAGWTGATFNHGWWPLTGQHTVPPLSCSQCHAGGNYSSNPPTACSGCHMADYNGTTNPSHLSSTFPTTCQTCHTTAGWTGASFNHSWWPLNGGHTVPPRVCTDCHIGGNYSSNPPISCVGCHLALYSATTSPPHAANNFPQTCQTCHTTSGWQPATFNHTTYYPLSGAHVSPPLACTACHLGGNYALQLPTTCVGCHGTGAAVNPVYDGSSNATHQQLGLNPPLCTNCHGNLTWLPSTFSHASYPLTGLHIATQCTACHGTSGNYSSAPTTCAGCHMSDYTGTNAPPHASSNFPTTCQTCHTTAGWSGANFNHSWWPLTGLHTVPPRACTQCHIGGNYATNPPTNCSGCHMADYTATSNPPHAASNFPLTCQTCHTTSGWLGSGFVHSWWALTGQHTVPPRSCTDCHTGGNYTTTLPTTCVGCHLANYTGTTSPPHAANNFPQTCQSCHTTGAWQPATFNHSSYYPLAGAHVSPPLACTACHLGGNYTTTLPTTCVGCHGPNATVSPAYSASSNPTHQQLGTNPPVCTMCHGNSTWVPSSFTHSTWPLTGLHLPPNTTACAQCHAGRNYTSAPTACSGCHMADYTGTTNPPHASSQFPTTCQTCHTTSGWSGASFNHSWWPLVGQHQVPPRICSQCHINGNYSTTPNTCVGCHIANYTGTTNPPHVTSNFPQTCATCHNTSAWQPATFTHTNVGFNLTGAHVSPPLACGNCHINGNYSVTLPTTCVGCHQSDYNGTTNPNHGTLGLPTACANCHSTNAGWAPVTMNHSGITGACSACHMPDYNATTNPDHEVQGYPLTCSSAGSFTCHTSTTSWVPNGFNPATTHDNTFRLPHHNSRCNQCHTTVQVFTAFSCISGGCHGQSSTNSNHSGVSGYQYNSNACYNCHPAGTAGLTGPGGPGGPTSSAVRLQRVRPGRRMPPQLVPVPVTPAPAPIPVPIPHRP